MPRGAFGQLWGPILGVVNRAACRPYVRPTPPGSCAHSCYRTAGRAFLAAGEENLGSWGEGSVVVWNTKRPDLGGAITPRFDLGVPFREVGEPRLRFFSEPSLGAKASQTLFMCTPNVRGGGSRAAGTAFSKLASACTLRPCCRFAPQARRSLASRRW